MRRLQRNWKRLSMPQPQPSISRTNAKTFLTRLMGSGSLFPFWKNGQSSRARLAASSLSVGLRLNTYCCELLLEAHCSRKCLLSMKQQCLAAYERIFANSSESKDHLY